MLYLLFILFFTHITETSFTVSSSMPLQFSPLVAIRRTNTLTHKLITYFIITVKIKLLLQE